MRTGRVGGQMSRVTFSPRLGMCLDVYNLGAVSMKRTFDFIGLNTVISEAFKPLPHVNLDLARKAGMEAGINGTTPSNCHHSYFADEALEAEWYRGYHLGKQNREEA